MNILIACAENPFIKQYSSQESLIQAFRDLGHNVITCGPQNLNYFGDLKSTLRDIKVYDKLEHPEKYTYDEILSKLDKTPDLILQTDPNFFFVGNKPSNIPCAYYIVDVHRGASVFRKMALEGKFDFVFIAQKYFIPIFKRVKLNCYWLPRAYNSNYIKEYKDIEIECDISFIGENGFSKEMNIFNALDADLDINFHIGIYPGIDFNKKYRCWDNHTMEYAERAEILHRLSKDFNLRVYDNNTIKSRGEGCAKIISRGKITVNHSLWKDSALRNFEVLACNRLLITDNLPFQDELLLDNVHCRTYNQYFLPFISNFDLEYEEIKELVKYYLDNEKEMQEIAVRGMEFVKKYHTFKNRAQTIIDTIFNGAEGYVKPY